MNVMSYKGYKACIMEAERLKGDHVFQLPPGNPLNIYYANQFKAYPEDWVKEGAFVIPVKPEKGLWFDFRMNDHNNTAVLMSVKGCNPITGLPLSGFHLDRYEKKCPVHNCDFIGERYCKECGYKWPDRSYLSQNPLWWDGWMTEGVIRQFFFTSDMMRDVATHRIGKENTVPAFGFAFYSPKEKRQRNNILRSSEKFKSIVIEHETFCSAPPSPMSYEIESPSVSYSCSDIKGCTLDELPMSKSLSSKSLSPMLGSDLGSGKKCSGFSTKRRITKSVSRAKEESIVKKKESVSIGAGAKIAQELPQDSYGVDTWKDTPDSIMTIYFMFQDEFDELSSKGFHDIEKSNKGILEGIPIG